MTSCKQFQGPLPGAAQFTGSNESILRPSNAGAGGGDQNTGAHEKSKNFCIQKKDFIGWAQIVHARKRVSSSALQGVSPSQKEFPSTLRCFSKHTEQTEVPH